MEFFSRILHSHIIAGQFSFHPKCHDLGIMHICCVDDLFILYSPDYASFHILQNVPLEFHKFSGLQHNRGKSKFILVVFQSKLRLPFVV